MQSLKIFTVQASTEVNSAEPVFSATDSMNAAMESVMCLARLKCLEYAEANGKQPAGDKDAFVVAVLAAESKTPAKEGYYARWNDDVERPELRVFFMRVKADGLLFGGSQEEREVTRISVNSTEAQLFDGVYKRQTSGDEDSADGGGEYELDSSCCGSLDSDDETYVPPAGTRVSIHAKKPRSALRGVFD